MPQKSISNEGSGLAPSVSGILLRIPHAHTGHLYAFFDGQIAVLKTQESFPGRLLITRTKTNDKTKDGFSLKDIHGFEYNHIIYDMLMPDKKVFWLDTLNERLKNSAVSVSKNFDQKWRVYSTNTKAAELLLRDCGKIRNYLLNTPRIAFILYDNNRIVFGGKYDFSLTDSASAEVSAESKAAIKAFFTKNSVRETATQETKEHLLSIQKDKCAILGKGVYFTDVIDYCWFYGSPKGNRDNCNKIPKIKDTFTLIASSVYYNQKGFKRVYNSMKPLKKPFFCMHSI